MTSTLLTQAMADTFRLCNLTQARINLLQGLLGELYFRLGDDQLLTQVRLEPRLEYLAVIFTGPENFHFQVNITGQVEFNQQDVAADILRHLEWHKEKV